MSVWQKGDDNGGGGGGVVCMYICLPAWTALALLCETCGITGGVDVRVCDRAREREPWSSSVCMMWCGPYTVAGKPS
jgi:hypothetical protein